MVATKPIRHAAAAGARADAGAVSRSALVGAQDARSNALGQEACGPTSAREGSHLVRRRPHLQCMQLRLSISLAVSATGAAPFFQGFNVVAVSPSGD